MFTVLDRISRPGSPDKANEDACGASGDWAWVIDTSIFPGTAPIMNDTSDAAWLAGFANGRLAELAPEARDGVALARRAMEDARDAFMGRASGDRLDFLTWPLGAMTLVRRSADSLDVWTFGDTTAYVRGSDGTVLTLGEAPQMRTLEAAKAAELLQATGASPATITATPLFQAWLAERRRRQKAGKGLALLGLDPTAADRLAHRKVPCEDETVVLLASDGFSALVDLYGHMNAEELMAAALASGLEPLVGKAREIETEIDPAARLYPRFKVSDDATALLLRA